MYFTIFFIFRKVPKEFHLAYDKLEDRPSLPTNLPGQHVGGSVPTAVTSRGSPAPPGGPMGLPQQMSPNMNSGSGIQPPPGAGL